ncbi:MAG: hypothetical protein FJX74_16500, partial [Armatimonadetes bacterium]|nr:hypothetical protein [Armatimonadota bacterium]
MAEQRSPNAIVPGGLADGPFDALDDCFRGERLLAAGTGIAVAFVLSGAVGTAASTYLLRNSLVHAALLGLVAGFLIYAGLLITYGALTRMAAAERNGLEVSPAAAFGFSLRRSHVLIAVPLFVLVVAVGAGSFFAYLGAAAARSQGFGAGLAPVALVLLFALNLLLVVAALVAHCLTAPCVACLDASSATVVARLIQVGRERLGAFLAHQAAALVVGLPLLLLTTGLFLAAFQPAFTSLAAGRAEALAQRRAQEAPARPPALPDGSAAEASRDWVERLQGWAGWAA